MTQSFEQIAGPSDRRPIRFGLVYSPGGSHPAGWRYPGGSHDPFAVDQITEVAREAERGEFDFIQFRDRILPDLAGGPEQPEALARLAPFTVASFLATRTRGIGFVVTANASYFEPFNLARITASLDHVTHGRAAWNIMTGATQPIGRNFSQGEVDPEAHLSRASEVVQVIRKLWDSWEDDAFIRNKATGDYVDGAKIHPINHQGALFSIKGPLNVARPPQGQLVIAHDVSDSSAIDLAAREADLAFVHGESRGAVHRLVKAVRDARAAQSDLEGIIIFADVTPVVAETTEAARKIYHALNALIPLDADIALGGEALAYWLGGAVIRGDGRPGERNLGALSGRIGIDLTQLALDDSITPELGGRLGGIGRELLDRVTERTGRTVGSAAPPSVSDLLFAHIVPGRVIVGDAAHVVDGFEALVAATGADGLQVNPAVLPAQLENYVALVVPELRARGLLDTHYEASTLRARFGFDRPANRLVAA